MFISSYLIVSWFAAGFLSFSYVLYKQWEDGEDIMADDILYLMLFTCMGYITLIGCVVSLYNTEMTDTIIKKGNSTKEGEDNE